MKQLPTAPTGPSTPHRLIPRGGFVLFVAAGVFLAYVAIMRATFPGWDAKSMASVGRNLWFHGSLEKCCGGFGSFPNDPSPYAKFGIGTSLVTAPLWGIDAGQSPTQAVWVMLASPMLLAATAAVIARTALVLGWRRSTAVLCAFSFAFGTMAAVYSQVLFAECGVTLGAALAILGYTTWWRGGIRSGAWLLGAGIATAVLFRADSIALVGLVAVCVVFFCPPRTLFETRGRWLVGLTAPIALATTWTVLYNAIRFGSPFDFGYAGPYDVKGFSNPLLDGVGQQLWSPGKSFFLYSPILALAIPGLVFMWRRHRPLAATLIIVGATRVLFYARWWTPVGGSSWGPRFLLPLCALLALPVGAAIEYLHRERSIRTTVGIAAAILLAACSIAVQTVGVSTEWRLTELQAVQVANTPIAAQQRVIATNEHHLEWTFGGSPIRQAVAALGHGWTPTYWFADGRTTIGLSFAFLATILCLATLTGPFGRRRRDRAPLNGSGAIELPMGER